MVLSKLLKDSTGNIRPSMQSMGVALSTTMLVFAVSTGVIALDPDIIIREWIISIGAFSLTQGVIVGGVKYAHSMLVKEKATDENKKEELSNKSNGKIEALEKKIEALEIKIEKLEESEVIKPTESTIYNPIQDNLQESCINNKCVTAEYTKL